MPEFHFFLDEYERYYLITEFIEGTVYKHFGDMPSEVLAACRERVREMHSIGLLHGDLRGPNFIVRKNNNVCVIDFGRSKLLSKNSKQLQQEMKEFISEAKL